MINILRTHQRPVLIAVTVLTIIAFIFLYNPDTEGQAGSNIEGQIYGRDVRTIEVQQFAKKRRLAYALGLAELVQTLSYGVMSDRESSSDFQFTWNGLIIQHEAAALGIIPTTAQIQAYIEKMPAFQTEAQFDSTKYNQFKINALGPQGITENQFGELVVLALQVDTLKQLVAGPVSVSKAQIDAEITRGIQQAKMQAVVVPLEDLKKDITLSEEEIQKAYDAEKEHLKDPAKREIEFVSFLMTEEQKKLTGIDKGNALKALLKQARDFSLKMVEANADFAKVAEEMKTTPQDGGEVIGIEGEKLPPANDIGPAIERLTETDPNSDPLQGPDGFYVLHLKKMTPARQKTLEETKEQLSTKLIAEKARELAKTKAEDARVKLEASLKEGKTFGDAATAVGLKAEDLPAFSPSEPNLASLLTRAFAQSLISTKTGSLTKVLPSQEGWAIGFVAERLPIDEAKLKEAQEGVLQNFNRQLKHFFFTEWLQEARKTSGLNARQG